MEFIQDEQKRKYIAINNIKHWIPDSETRNALGYRISNFKPISQIKMKSYQSGSPIESVRNVKLIRDKNNHKDIYALFIIPTNTKRHIPNLKTLEAMGRSQKQTEYVETDEFNSYPTGEPIDDVKNWDSLDKISSNKKSWQDNIFFLYFYWNNNYINRWCDSRGN